MVKYFTNEFSIEKNFKRCGAFDSILNLDSKYYVNIKRLQKTAVPEFEHSYEKVIEFFYKLGEVLMQSQSIDDAFFKDAFEMFNFPECNEVNLGYSSGVFGRAFGDKLRRDVIINAKKIIDAGEYQPEVFQLIGLFQKNVDADRLSDMIADIILEDIEAYTRRIFSLFNISKQKYPDKLFDKTGMALNPYKTDKNDAHIRILLVPCDILHILPIGNAWASPNSIYSNNQDARDEINYVVGEIWSKLKKSQKKDKILDVILCNPTISQNVLNAYKETEVDPYDFDMDPVGDYRLPHLIDELFTKVELKKTELPRDSYEYACQMCEDFIDVVSEYWKKGVLLDKFDQQRQLSVLQRLFYLASDFFCSQRGYPDALWSKTGRGPIHFNYNKTGETTVHIRYINRALNKFKRLVDSLAQSSSDTNEILLVIVDKKNEEDKLKKIETERISALQSKKRTPKVYTIQL